MSTEHKPSSLHAIERSLRILVIDDEPRIRQVLRQCLKRDGHQVMCVSTADEALSQVEMEHFDVAFLDLRLQEKDGLDYIEPLVAREAQLKIIVITAHASIDSAVEAIKLGASDYLPKPFSPEQIRLALAKVVEVKALEDRVVALESHLNRAEPDELLGSQSPPMQTVLEEARHVAPNDVTVLLRGESGTGKGMLARRIHEWSKRGAAPFVTVHAPSLSAELLESELFGHAKGAFTGAVKANPGRIALAEGGTLLLDEVGDLPLALQPKLLRFLQDKAYERVGDPHTRYADVRILAATNRELAKMVDEGTFRQDLLYRLNVIELTVPPLRERAEDVVPLAKHFAHTFGVQYNRPVEGFTEDAVQALQRHAWPGNVRELQNAIERAVILGTSPHVSAAQLPFTERSTAAEPVQVGQRVTLHALERAHIVRTIDATDTLEEAARVLGIDPTTLWRKRQKHGL